MHWHTDAILEGAAKLAETTRMHRRAIHRLPELAYDEYRTAAYIESALDELGVPHRRVVDTGVVAVVRGQGPGCVGVRADLDALPVPEAPGREGYRSEVEGLSHACGHDAHAAVLLGLAELLVGVEELPGTVVLYFQPAEEGPGGAMPMVEAGVLDDPAPSAVLGLHVSSRHQSGVIGLRSGPSTASDDAFDILVEGVGGHAAHPEEAVDPVPVAAEIVTAVQQLVTREVNPVTPVVFTFGSINGGTRRNVIATSVALSGTLRTVHRANRQLLVTRIPQMCRAIAEAHRATVRVRHQPGYDVGVNDPALTDLVAEAARAVAGEQRVVREQYPTMGGEDFYAFGSTGLPVNMFLLGIANPDLGITAPNHSPEFDLDEDALPTGVAVFAETIRRLLVAG